MLPTIKQYKKWSLPSKYSLWGYIIGILGLALTIYSMFLGKDSAFEDLVKKDYQPKIIIQNVLFEKWVGDNDEFLTAEIYNDSKGSALNFKMELLIPGINQKIIPTNTSSVFAQKNFSIKSQQEIGIPVISLGQLKQILKEKGVKGSLIGVGLTPSLPKLITDKLENKYRGNYTTTSVSIGLGLSYKGMNSELYKSINLVHVYFDETGIGSSTIFK